MAKDPVGTSGLSTSPSAGGMEGSRKNPPKITPAQMKNNFSYFQQEFSVGRDDVTLEGSVEIKAISDHGTLYYRAETVEHQIDLNNIPSDKKPGNWFSFNQLENAVQAVGEKAPEILKDAGESFIDAGMDLLKQVTVQPEKQQPPKSPEDEKKQAELLNKKLASEVRNQEMFNILQMPKHEVKVVSVGGRPMSLEEVNKARKINVNFTGDVQENGQLTANAEAETLKAISDTEKAAQAAKTPFQIVQARNSKLGGSSRLDQANEGGLLSSTGGAGVG